MQQREADHQRNLSEYATRARQAVAEKTRARWESHEQQLANTDYTHAMNGGGSTANRVALGDHPNRREGHEARPFLRKKRLDRFGAPNGAPSGGAAVSEPKIGSGGSISSNIGGGGNGGGGGGGGGGELDVGRRNQQAVQRDHVRSVVQLALSGSRVNAFVAISSLKGLLAVATEGLGGGSGREEERGGRGRPGGETTDGMVGDQNLTRPPSISSSLARGPEKSDPPEASDSTKKSKTRDEKRSHRRSRADRRKERPPNKNRMGSHSSDLKGEAIARSESAAGKNAGSTDRARVGGAALCVKLGALPAVLGCLEEHRGHKVVEPLCVRLLHVFASDGATRGSIEGDAAVATACAARMFPTAAAETLSESTISGTTAGIVSSTSERQAAGKGKAERLPSLRGNAGVDETPAAVLETITELPHGDVPSADVDLDVDRQAPGLDAGAGVSAGTSASAAAAAVAAAAAAGCGELPADLSSFSNLSAAVVSASSKGEGLAAAAAAATGYEPGMVNGDGVFPQLTQPVCG